MSESLIEDQFMDPADLFQQAQQVLKERLAEAASFEGHEAYEAAQPHVQKLSAALQTAQQQVAQAMDKAKAAQANAQAQAAAIAAQAQAAQEARAQVPTKPAGAASAVPFEDAQGLDPKRVQEAIQILLHGRARTAAAEVFIDDRDLSDAWSDPEIPPEATTPKPAASEQATPKAKPRPKTEPRPAEARPDDSQDLDMEIWEDLPP